MIISYFEKSHCSGSVHGDQPVCNVVETPGSGEIYPVKMNQLAVSPVCNLQCEGCTERGRGEGGGLSLPLQAAGQTRGREVGAETGEATG